MTTLTTQLASFCADTSFEDLPEKVVLQAKENILDTVGCALAGTRFPEVSGMLREISAVEGPGECPIWGMKEKAPLLTAVLVNGALCHCVEMDDVHKTSKTHTGAAMIPAALTYAGSAKRSGKELITAVVLGYETAFRVGAGINAAAHRLQGWHATGTCCPYGSAAAVSKLMSFDAEKTRDALGLAGTMSSGLWALTKDGSNCKKTFMGRAAQSGVLSALFAKGGFTGPAYIIEAEDGGFFRAASSGYDFSKVVSELGSRWEILKTDHKPYACCRSAQPPIDAILALKQKHGITAEMVESVLVETYDIAVKQCFNTKRPANVVEAQLCTPYTVAVALIDGRASARQFTMERIQDEKLMALAARVDVVETDEFTSRYPQSWGCRLILKTKDGKEFTETIPNAKGDSANPLSEAEIVAKFKGLGDSILPDATLDAIAETVFALEKVPSAATVTDLLFKK